MEGERPGIEPAEADLIVDTESAQTRDLVEFYDGKRTAYLTPAGAARLIGEDLNEVRRNLSAGWHEARVLDSGAKLIRGKDGWKISGHGDGSDVRSELERLRYNFNVNETEVEENLAA